MEHASTSVAGDTQSFSIHQQCKAVLYCCQKSIPWISRRGSNIMLPNRIRSDGWFLACFDFPDRKDVHKVAEANHRCLETTLSFLALHNAAAEDSSERSEA